MQKEEARYGRQNLRIDCYISKSTECYHLHNVGYITPKCQRGPEGKAFSKVSYDITFPRVSWKLLKKRSCEAPSRDQIHMLENSKRNTFGLPLMNLEVNNMWHIKIHHCHKSHYFDDNLDMIRWNYIYYRLVESSKLHMILKVIKLSECLSRCVHSMRYRAQPCMQFHNQPFGGHWWFW